MPSTASQLSALANDAQFQNRIKSLLIQEAVVVYAEAPATPDKRRDFAKQILLGNINIGGVSSVVANLTNLIAGNTTYDFVNGRVITDVTDAAIASQLGTSWNLLAGV